MIYNYCFSFKVKHLLPPIEHFFLIQFEYMAHTLDLIYQQSIFLIEQLKMIDL